MCLSFWYTLKENSSKVKWNFRIGDFWVSFQLSVIIDDRAFPSASLSVSLRILVMRISLKEHALWALVSSLLSYWYPFCKFQHWEFLGLTRQNVSAGGFQASARTHSTLASAFVPNPFKSEDANNSSPPGVIHACRMSPSSVRKQRKALVFPDQGVERCVPVLWSGPGTCRLSILVSRGRGRGWSPRRAGQGAAQPPALSLRSQPLSWIEWHMRRFCKGSWAEDPWATPVCHSLLPTRNSGPKGQCESACRTLWTSETRLSAEEKKQTRFDLFYYSEPTFIPQVIVNGLCWWQIPFLPFVLLLLILERCWGGLICLL